MKYICVFASSSEKVVPKYRAATEQFARQIVENDYGLVYGGGNTGLMKVLKEAYVAEGGLRNGLFGVVTPAIKKLGAAEADERLSLIIELNNQDRQAKMNKISDAFVALPGGDGTMDELTRALIDKQFASYDPKQAHLVKPVCVLNWEGYYDGYLQQRHRQMIEGSLSRNHYEMLFESADPREVLKHINQYKPSAADDSKWWLGLENAGIFAGAGQNQQTAPAVENLFADFKPTI